MPNPIGFVLVTHKNPEQVKFLSEWLTKAFNHPPIAIHHDFTQSDLVRSHFPENVRFVDDWGVTGWGTIGVVDGLLSALRLLYQSGDGWGDPDWTVSLSSADFPIKTPAKILADLRTSEWDAYLDMRKIEYYPGAFRNEPLGEFPFQQPRYHQFAFNRYMAIPLLSAKLARYLKVPVEKFCLRQRALIEKFTPFRSGYSCFAGDAWMTIRRSVAHFFLDKTLEWERLREHLSTRQVPEECFYHTLLGNTDRFTICQDNLRFTDWKGCYAHPRTLGFNDFPKLLASNQHFARKFPFDPVMLQELTNAVALEDQSPA